MKKSLIVVTISAKEKWIQSSG